MRPASKTRSPWGGQAFAAGAASVRGLLSAAILGGTLVLGFVYLGCSEKTQYDVLSFFFDGVPPPGGPGASSRPAGGPLEANAPLLAEAERPMVSAHSPYEHRRCVQCHGVDNAISPSDLFGGRLCRQCHADLFEPRAGDWVHGPAAVGQCRFCHKPHESEEPVLLTAPQPALCFRCHDSAVLQRPYHGQAAGMPCSSCHDPHRAGNRLLLADSRTYERSKLLAQLRQSVHKPFEEHQCDACHEIEVASVLKGEVNALCRSCHADAMKQAGARLHAPVRQGRCALCHEPHESPLPHLVKPKGEEICLSCHSLEEIRGGSHPPIERASCVLCHQGHRSERGALLRPGIPSQRYPQVTSAPGAGPAPTSRPEGGQRR